MNTFFFWVFFVTAALALFISGIQIGSGCEGRTVLVSLLWFIAYVLLTLACWLVKK